MSFFKQYFNENPLLFKASDDTVYSGHEVLRGNMSLEAYDTERIIGYDWRSTGTDITAEIGPLSNGKKSIQEAVQEHLLSNSKYSHIIFDHGSGEIADYITFRPDGSFIRVELYHCKSMKGKNYNSTVEDVYEVSQQSIKCTVWLKSKNTLLEKIQARIKGASRNKFIKGDIRSLKSLLHTQKAMEVVIYIVQPAISKKLPMHETVSKVLSAATFYVRHTGRAKELLVLGSM